MKRPLVDAAMTEAIGVALGRVMRAGDVIALIGELGAGKTSLTRGIAIGAGVDGVQVASPTFALVHQYDGQVPVAHLDWYRLERERDLDELGIDELIDRGEAAVLIEWADRFAHRLPADHLRIELHHDGDRRRLAAQAGGPTSAARLAAWAAALTDEPRRDP